MISYLLFPLRRFGRDRRGVSAIEFALIAPLMALFYMGSVELASTLLADRKVTTASATLGDLIARMNTADNCEIDLVFDATRLIFQPYTDNGVRLRITSIVPNATNPSVMEVDWSYANSNWTALTSGSTITIPTGVMPTNGSVLRAEVEYTYSPPFNRVFQTDPLLTNTFYMRPRGVVELDFATIGTCP